MEESESSREKLKKEVEELKEKSGVTQSELSNSILNLKISPQITKNINQFFPLKRGQQINDTEFN